MATSIIEEIHERIRMILDSSRITNLLTNECVERLKVLSISNEILDDYLLLEFIKSFNSLCEEYFEKEEHQEIEEGCFLSGIKMFNYSIMNFWQTSSV